MEILGVTLSLEVSFHSSSFSPTRVESRDDQLISIPSVRRVLCFNQGTRRQALRPPPEQRTPIIQRPTLRAFQRNIDLRLATTNSRPVRFVNMLDDSVPNDFLYTENTVKTVAGGGSALSSRKQRPCECVHCRKESGVNMGTWLTLEVSLESRFFLCVLLTFRSRHADTYFIPIDGDMFEKSSSWARVSRNAARFVPPSSFR